LHQFVVCLLVGLLAGFVQKVRAESSKHFRIGLALGLGTKDQIWGRGMGVDLDHSAEW